MSGLGNRLLHDVTNGRGDQPLGSIVSQLGELVAAYGSEVKAAQATGFARSTFWRWKTGKTKPRVATLGKVATLVREARVDPARPTDHSVRLEVSEWRSGRRDGGERVLSGSQLGLRGGTMSRVVGAYIATGDPEVMAREFVKGVTVGFYKNALSAGLDQAPSGPVDAPGGGQSGDDGDEDTDDEDEAVYDLYEEYDVADDFDLMYEGDDDVPDGGSYGFDVA